mgnify:CR=1 FL=1
MNTGLYKRVRDNVKGMKKYKPGKGIKEVRKEYGLDKVIKMASNENPLGHSEQVLECLREADCNFHHYPDSNCNQLKNSLADFHNINKNKLFIGNGSDEIIDHIMTVFVEKGDEVILADPSFIKYKLAVQASGGIGKKIPLTEDYRHDLSRMAEAVTEKTKVIFICDPNNPTGTTVDRKKLLDFIDEVPSDILLVVDQAYYEYVTETDYLQGLELIDQYSNLILLRTFSKIYGMAGFRVGYGIANSQLVELLNRVRSPFNVNKAAQKAAVAALQDQQHVKNSRACNENGKTYLYNALDELGLQYIHTQGNFILIDTEHDAVAVFEKLMRQGVIIRPGNIFGLPTWIRVTIGRKEDNQEFIKQLKDIISKGEL